MTSQWWGVVQGGEWGLFLREIRVVYPCPAFFFIPMHEYNMKFLQLNFVKKENKVSGKNL